MSRAAFLLLLLLPSSAHADTWIGGAIAGNYQASEQLPTDGNAKSLEVEAGVYRWRDAEARWGYHAGVNVEKYVGMFEGASAMMGTARFGRTLRYDESDQMFGRLAHWKLGQAFAHPYRALAFYGAGRFMTDVLVENVLESPDAPRRDLVGAGGGFSFERRDQNGFHVETRLDLYVFAADGIPKDIEFEGGGGFSYFDLKLQIRFGDATGFTVGVGLGLRGFHLY